MLHATAPKPNFVESISKLDCISVSDWVLFEGFNGVARVLEFKKIGSEIDTNAKERYPSYTLNLSTETEPVGVLLHFYTVNSSGGLMRCDPEKPGVFINSILYKATIPKPKHFSLQPSIFEDLQNFQVNVNSKHLFSKNFWDQPKKLPKNKRQKRENNLPNKKQKL